MAVTVRALVAAAARAVLQPAVVFSRTRNAAGASVRSRLGGCHGRRRGYRGRWRSCLHVPASVEHRHPVEALK